MNHRPDHERLLADALADEAPAGFREALLGETLNQIPGRVHFFQAQLQMECVARHGGRC